MAQLIVLVGKTNTLDLTSFIPVPEYKVQDVRNFVSWVDGNYSLRRHTTDYKAQGTFKLKFPNKETYLNFVEFVKANEDDADGSIVCDVYCVNRNIAKRVNAFLDFEPQDEMPIMADHETDGFDVAFTERGNV